MNLYVVAGEDVADTLCTDAALIELGHRIINPNPDVAGELDEMLAVVMSDAVIALPGADRADPAFAVAAAQGIRVIAFG